MFHLTHIAAMRGALIADIGAGFHFGAAEFFTGDRAGITDISAGFTDIDMHGRLSYHRVSRQLANLDTIRHQIDMCRHRMLAANDQAMSVERGLAFVAAFPADIDALLQHFWRIIYHAATLLPVAQATISVTQV
jgi:hypothetical protein